MIPRTQLVPFAIVFVDLLGYGIVVPVLVFHAASWGASGAVLGLILGSFSLTQFFVSPFLGRLSDKIGRKPVILACLSLNVLGFGAFAVATTVPVLFLSRILSGIAAGSVPAVQAYLADASSNNRRTEHMGMISLAFGLGLLAGPPLAGFLSEFGVLIGLEGTSLPGAVAATLSFFSAILAAVSLRDVSVVVPPKLEDAATSGKPAGIWFFLKSPELLLSGAALATLMMVLAALTPLLTFLCRDVFEFGIGLVGLLFGAIGAVVAVIQLGMLRRLVERHGDAGTARIGAVALLGGLVIVASIPRVAALGVSVLLLGTGYALCHAALTAIVSKAAPVARRGNLLGITASLGAGGRVLGPVMAGAVYDRLGASTAIYGQALLATVAAVLCTVLSRRQRKRVEH